MVRLKLRFLAAFPDHLPPRLPQAPASPRKAGTHASSHGTPCSLGFCRTHFAARLGYPLAAPGIILSTHNLSAISRTVGTIRIHSGIPVSARARSARSYQSPRSASGISA